MNKLRLTRPSDPNINALLAAGAITFAAAFTALIASLVYLAVPSFGLGGFIATLLVGMGAGVALTFIIKATRETSLDLAFKIAAVEGFAGLALIPIHAGTTLALICLLVVALSYGCVLTILCSKSFGYRLD